MRDVLHDLGIVSIDEVSDSYAAVPLVRNNPYDLVVCEWNDSPISGIDVVRTVRGVGHDTAVLLISSDVCTKRTVEALETGANGLLAKPFSESRLREKVMRIISSLAPPPDFVHASRLERFHGDDTWMPR